MLENPTTDSSATVNNAPVKRYAPPNQRNRSLGRRKSGGDRLERANSLVNDGEKNRNNASRSTTIMDHGDAGSSTHMIETSRNPSISIHGCCGSEAFQLLNSRWIAAMNAHNHLPEDSAERPVLYSRSASPLGHVMLPHLLMQPTTGTKGISSELQQATRNANASSDA